MPTIEVCLRFLGGKGHAYIHLIPSEEPIGYIDKSGCTLFQAVAGTDYTVMIQGVSPPGGTELTVFVNNVKVKARTLAKGRIATRVKKLIP